MPEPYMLELQHHRVEPPGWPGVVLDVIVASEAGEQKIYWPVRTICEDVLRISSNGQIERLRRDGDFAPLLRTFPMQTTKGLRDAIYLEFEALGGWLQNIQSQRVRPEMREHVKRFRREAWRAANEIIFGKNPPTRPELDAPSTASVIGAPRVRQHITTADVYALTRHLEERMGQYERQRFAPIAYVSESDEDGSGIVCVPFTCAHGAYYVITLRLHASFEPEVIAVTPDDP